MTKNFQNNFFGTSMHQHFNKVGTSLTHVEDFYEFSLLTIKK